MLVYQRVVISAFDDFHDMGTATEHFHMAKKQTVQTHWGHLPAFSLVMDWHSFARVGLNDMPLSTELDKAWITSCPKMVPNFNPCPQFINKMTDNLPEYRSVCFSVCFQVHSHSDEQTIPGS